MGRGGVRTSSLLLATLLTLLAHVVSQHESPPTNKKIPILGNATIGNYFINVFVGEQMQKQTLIIDTGSGLTVFPCQDCGDCGKNHFNEPFRMPMQTVNDKQVRTPLAYIRDRAPLYGWSCDYFEDDADPKCSFYISYYEGSEYAGQFVHETVVFEHELAKAAVQFQRGARYEKYGAVIGCVSQESGEVKNQKADGIIGLGLTANSRSMFS